MTEEFKRVEMIPISEIKIMNPRARNRRVFVELVSSIASLGLKKPITVSRRADGDGYNLVCGQGRLEAFIELGQETIPAAVINAPPEDCLVMSLVENLARRQHSSLELVKEIGALRERGYTVSEIAAKTDFSYEYAQAICVLLETGEEKLLAGVEKGIIPPTVAMEIAKAKDGEMQDALTEAYAQKLLPGRQVLAIRKIIESRETLGKQVSRSHRLPGKSHSNVSAQSLVKAYKKESDRQKAFIKNANLTKSRLVLIVESLKRLLEDENFVNLLRAEQLLTMPRQIADLLPANGVKHA
jgi:ParB family chromosome partitioning protein